MALWWDRGQIINDQDEGVHIPQGATRVDTYKNVAQYGDQEFTWDPTQKHFGGNIESNAPGYLPELLARRERAEQLQPYEREELERWEATARAMPTRDIASLTAGWQGDKDSADWWSRLDPMSPDAGGIMLALRDKMDAGTATEQERAMFNQVRGMAEDWDYRASVPQASDAFNPLGDQFFSALGVLGLGATGGLAAAPLAAGGASLATTLGSLGTLSGIAGTGASVLGQATDQEWLQKLGMGLGAAGGIAGGIGGLSNVLSTGVNSLSDAARLAQSASRITGALGKIPGAESLGDVSSYLDMAGKLGSGVNTIADVFGSDTMGLRDAFRLASGLGQVTNVAGRVTGNRPLQQASQVLGLGSRLGQNIQGTRGTTPQDQRRGGQPQRQQRQAPQGNTPMTNDDWLRLDMQTAPWQQAIAPTLWNL